MATYLIDTENVGTAWLAVAEQMFPEDRMCVFAFSGDAKMSINFSMLETCIRAAGQIEIVWCGEKVHSKNAMDFAIASYVGLCAAKGEGEIYIVSNDSDYEVLSRFWTQRGIRVEKMAVGQGYANAKERSVSVPELPLFAPEPEMELETNPRKKRIRVLLNGDSEATELVCRVCETIPEDAKKKDRRFLDALEKEPRFKKMAEREKKKIMEKANGVAAIYFNRQQKAD